MNAASARTARRFLLLFSILCAVTYMPPRAVEAGARFGLRQKRPPQITEPPLPKIFGRRERPLRFVVTEGVSRREFPLLNPCGLPHLFRVSSSEKFFRFEGQAEGVRLAPKSPQGLGVIIDTEGLRLSESGASDFDVSVLVECLDCGQEQTCADIRRTVAVKVTVHRRKPTHDPGQDGAPAQGEGSTPPPNLDDTHPPKHDAIHPPGQNPNPVLPPTPPPAQSPAQPPGAPPAPTPDAEAERLSKHGPEFPDTFNLSDFKFRAFLNSGWWLDFVYTLTQPGTVTLTVLVDGLPPFVQEFRMNAGWHEELIQLPNPFKLGAATYSVRAVTDANPAAGAVPFMVLSMAAGELAAADAPADRLTLPPPYYAPLRGARFTNASYGLNAAPGPPAVPLGLERVTFAPRDILLPADGPCANATYSFRTSRVFSGGARADIRLTEGGASTLVGGQLYEEQLDAGQTFGGGWDCTTNGAPSLGRHVLFVRAWFTVQAGGNWSFVHSPPVVVRR